MIVCTTSKGHMGHSQKSALASQPGCPGASQELLENGVGRDMSLSALGNPLLGFHVAEQSATYMNMNV